MSGLAVASRLARREVIRRPWRSVVVVLLVTAPVVMLSALVVLTRTLSLSWEEEWAMRSGTEDARIPIGGPYHQPDPWSDGPPVVSEPPRLPPGSHSVTVHWVSERIRSVDGGRMWGVISDRPLDDPISDGLIDRLEGRAPRTSDEVLLTPRLADALGVAVGDPLELDRPSEWSGTVVGIAEWGRRLDEVRLVIGTDDDPDAVGSLAPRSDQVGTVLLVDLPPEHEDDPAVTRAILAHGGDTWHQPPGWADDGNHAQVVIIWTWVGGAVAFIVLGVVIAAAFAVTARRQLRLIGQLMANGADRQTLLATLFLQGTVVGLVGGAVGLTVAVGGLHLFQPTVEHLLSRRLDGFDVRFSDLLPIVTIATLASTGAAVIPARSAIRTTVLQALAGRPPVGTYPARLVVRGGVAMAAGVFLLAVATGASAADDGHGPVALFVLTGIAGAISLLLGTCAVTPAIAAQLGPLAGSLRGTARLAARSVARQRTRTGAVIASIAVVAAGAVAGTTAWLTVEERDASVTLPDVPEDLVVVSYEERQIPLDPDGPWTPVRSTPPAELVAAVTAIVPDAVSVPNVIATDPEGLELQVVTPEWADAIRLHDDIRRVVDDGHVAVVLWAHSELPVLDELTVRDASSGQTHRVSQVPIPSSIAPRTSHSSLVSTETATSLGLELVPGRLVLRAPRPLTGDQRDSLADLNEELSEEHGQARWEPGDIAVFAYIDHPYERFEPSKALVTAAVVGAASLLALAVVGLGLALSAAETKDERDVLAAVGARPRTLRRLAGAKALILSGTGTVLGVPLGFIPIAVMLRAASTRPFDPYVPVFPWVQVAVLLVVVPLVAASVTTAVSGLALRLRPVTASSMAFD